MRGNTGFIGSQRAQGRGPEPASDRPTTKQIEALRLVHGGATFRQMQAALGLSVHAVISRVQPLVRKGYLVEISGPGTSHRYRATDAGLAELGLRRCAHCHGNGTVPKEEP